MNAHFLKIIVLLALNAPIAGVQSPVLSQSNWAPIGAEWDFTSYLNMYPTKIQWDHYVVEKDTVLLGRSCRKVNYTKTYYDGSTNAYSIYTYAKNDSIYFYHEAYTDFVLTYDFTAVVNDTLALVHWDEAYYDPFYLRLYEEESIPINGDTSLTQFNYSLVDGTFCPIYTSVIKNIGSLSGLLPYYCTPIVATENIEFRCYRDNNIEYSISDDCDFYGMINSTQNLKNRNVSIFPNPAIDQLTISINLKFKNLRVISSFGQEMWNTSSHQKQFNLNVQHWPAGQYYLLCEGEESNSGQWRFTIF